MARANKAAINTITARTKLASFSIAWEKLFKSSFNFDISYSFPCGKRNMKIQRKKPRYKVGTKNLLTKQSAGFRRRFLLSSRLYCWFWNFTKSAVTGKSHNGSRTVPPVGNFTLPRRISIFNLYYAEKSYISKNNIQYDNIFVKGNLNSLTLKC